MPTPPTGRSGKVEETAEDIGGNGTNWVHGRVNAHDAVKPSVP